MTFLVQLIPIGAGRVSKPMAGHLVSQVLQLGGGGMGSGGSPGRGSHV
jgi:hypothetical protein